MLPCVKCGSYECWLTGNSDPSQDCDIYDSSSSSETLYESESECSQCGGDMDIECWLLSCESEKLHKLLHDPAPIKEEPTSNFFTYFRNGKYLY